MQSDPNFDKYVSSSNLTHEQIESLRAEISSRRNFIIVGAPSSGKTTLSRAILQEMSLNASPDERFVIIEDVPELCCTAQNRVNLIAENGYSMAEIIKLSMRLGPKHLCVGELRGPEAADLIKAWNTGHNGGITTIHASDARSALDRLEKFILEAGEEPMRRRIADAIQVIVVVANIGDDYRITKIFSLDLDKDGEYLLVEF